MSKFISRDGTSYFADGPNRGKTVCSITGKYDDIVRYNGNGTVKHSTFSEQHKTRGESSIDGPWSALATDKEELLKSGIFKLRIDGEKIPITLNCLFNKTLNEMVGDQKPTHKIMAFISRGNAPFGRKKAIPIALYQRHMSGINAEEIIYEALDSVKAALSNCEVMMHSISIREL